MDSSKNDPAKIPIETSTLTAYIIVVLHRIPQYNCYVYKQQYTNLFHIVHFGCWFRFSSSISNIVTANKEKKVGEITESHFKEVTCYRNH